MTQNKYILKGLSLSIDTPITNALLAQSSLPSMNGPEGVAERLVLLIHYGVDFSIWGNARRPRYWGALTERVKAATYSGPTLNQWWGEISTSLVSSPRNPEERAELLALLSVAEEREVLRVLRHNAEALVLRTRVISEARKSSFENKESSS